MHANEANRKAKNNEFSNIMKSILYSVQLGKTSTFLPDKLHPETIMELQKLGYEVKYEYLGNGSLGSPHDTWIYY